MLAAVYSHDRLPGCFAEERSDVYLVSCEKGAKKLGIKARGKADGGGIQAGDKGAMRGGARNVAAVMLWLVGNADVYSMIDEAVTLSY